MTSIRREMIWLILLYITVLSWVILPAFTVSQDIGDTDMAENTGEGSEERSPTIDREDIYYDSEGLSDPFVSLLVAPETDVTGTSKPPGIKGMTIGELAMFGLGSWESTPVAFVTGSDGKAYTLRVGDIVFDGRVKAIDLDKITFEKYVYDPLGRPKPPKTIEIKLHPTEEVP